MKLRHSFIAFFISLFTIFGVRLYQVINMGVLLNSQLKTIETICLGATLFFAFLIILMSHLSKNIPQKFELCKNNFLSVLAFLAGGLLLINGAVNIFTLFTAAEVEIVLLFAGIFSILTGVIFFVLGRGFLSGKNIFLQHPLIILVPILWLIIRLYQFFSIYKNTAIQVQNMSGEIAVIFLLLYFTHFAKLISGMYGEKVYKKLNMYGLSAALFVFMASTYSFFQMALNSKTNPYDMTIALTDLILAVFVVSFGYFLSKKGENAPAEETEAAEQLEDANKEMLPQVESSEPAAEQETTTQADAKTGGKFDMNSINKLIDEISN